MANRRTLLRTVLSTLAMLLVATALSVAPTVPASADLASGPTRVMLSGDSITQGFTGGYGSWRYWLWREIARTGQADQVDFVGPRDTVGHDGTYLRADGDRDHAALIGTQLVTQAGSINGYVATYQPDVLVVMLGHNDLRHGRAPGAVVDLMRTYIADARAAKPDVTIVVCEVMDALFQDGTRRFPGKNAEVNRGYAALAAELSTPESRVVLADTQYAGWHPRSMTWDGTHPTPAGGTRIAQRIGWALHRPAVGVLPQAPRIVADRLWRPNPAAAVRVTRTRRITLDWGEDKHRLRILHVRLWWRKVGSHRPLHHTRWRSSERLTTRVLTHGRYVLRLQPRRRWMVGARGSRIHVRIR